MSIKNIITKKPNKKFNSKWEEPFKILKKKNYLNYKINLPYIIKNYKTFHIFLLIKNPNNSLLEQEHPLSRPIEIAEKKEFKIKKILNIQKQDKGIIMLNSSELIMSRRMIY